MGHQHLTTEFAPPERVSQEEAMRQGRAFVESHLLCEMLNAVPEILVVLNRERQIVHANRSLLTLLGLEDTAEV